MRLIDADELIKKFRRSETNTENENHMCLVARRMISDPKGTGKSNYNCNEL